MSNKNRVLLLLHYLQDQSDEENPLSTARLRSELAERGCPATIETIRDDIDTLKAVGYDIIVNERSGLPTTYSYVDRAFDAPELQILIDAVASSQCITRSKSKAMISRLAGMAGPSVREKLEPSILVSERVKASNEHLFYIVQRIFEGIHQDRRIAFRYYRYDIHKKRLPRHEGKRYVISPYATIWKNDRYFMVGYSDERE